MRDVQTESGTFVASFVGQRTVVLGHRMSRWARRSFLPACVGAVIALVQCNDVRSAHALPFNQDMVGKQYITGSIMRQKEAGTVPVHSSSRQLPERAEIVQKWTSPFAADAGAMARASRHGERLFKVNCEVCHGEIKGGQHVPSDLMAKGLPSINLLLTQPKFDAQKTDGYVWAYIFSGLDAIMPRYGYRLSNEEIWELVAYIRKLQAENPM